MVVTRFFQAGKAGAAHFFHRGHGPHPAPQAAGKQNRCAELLVNVKQLAVACPVHVVVVPVNQRNIRQSGVQNGLGQLVGNVVVAAGGRSGAQVHVAPDHRREIVFLGKSRHPGEVPVHQFPGGDDPVFEAGISQPQRPGLVHADVDALGVETGPHSLEHLLDVGIYLFLPHHQAVFGVPQVGVILRPVQRPLQMRQGLDAGDELDAQVRRIPVQFPQLLLGVAAPQIAKIGLLRDFVGVLGVQHGYRHAHQGHFAQHQLHRVGGQHGIAGTVQHCTHLGKGRLLLPGEGLAGRLFQIGQSAEKLGGHPVFHLQRVFFQPEGKAAGPARGDRNAAFAHGKTFGFTQMPQARQEFLRQAGGGKNNQFHL